MLKPRCTTALFAVVLSLAIPAAAQSPNRAEMSSAAMPAAMPSVAPLFIESADFSSVLNLVNELRVPLQATVDVYSLDGVKAASETITMPAYSSRQLRMESIFASAVPLQLGSIRVNADHTSGLLAALSLTHRGSPVTYFDEELAMPSMEGSSVARGVADDAGGGSPITAITSLSSSPQNITLSCVPESGATQQRTLELGPNQTLLTRPCAGDLPAAVLSPSDIENGGSGAPASGSRTAAGIAVTSDAMPGEFAVYGIVPHGSKESPFFTSINFSDPKTRRSSGSTYVGVPVGPSPLLTDGSYSPEISIANFGPAAATVTLESASTVNGAPQRTTLATIVLAGGESRTVPLSNMPLSPGLTNGLRIHTDAAPGDVLSKLVSRGGSQLPVVEMLDKDERGAFNGGGHTWDVEPGVTSTLLLFNGDSTPQKVNLRFGTPTGPWMRRFTLEPMETRAINVNELIGMQEKDDSGLALPSNAQSGELGWQSDSTWVSGRLLQTSAALGMARSFSCSQWVYACAFTLSPTPSLTLYLNNTGNLSEIPDWAVYTGFHPPTTCSCANPTSGNTTLYDSWQSGNTSVATITSGGTSSASVWNGAGIGSTTSYFYGNNMFQGGGSLQCQASQPANVAPSITWNGKTINGTNQTVVVGEEIYLAGNPAGGIWTVSGTYVGGYQTGASGGYLQLATLNGQDVLFYWTVQGQNTVTYTVSGHVASATFTVEGPTYGGIVPTATAPHVFSQNLLKLETGSSPGMLFTGSETDNPSYPGAVSWLQIIASSSIKLTLSNSTISTCTIPNNSLDNQDPYKYGVGNQAQDSPSASLTSSWIKVEDAGSFAMFFMWQPNLSPSIKVPLGVVNWQWDGVATISGGVWSTTSPPASSVVSVPPKSAYPYWTSTYKNGIMTCGVTASESGGIPIGLGPAAGSGSNANTGTQQPRNTSRRPPSEGHKL